MRLDRRLLVERSSSVTSGGGIGNAPAAIRADRIVVDLGSKSVRLRYVSCPFAPFLDSSSQNVCQGL